MNRFYLIRHALTDTAGKYLSGRAVGIFLNEEGNGQAKRLANSLINLQISEIYTSPLDRTVQTAEIIAKTLNLACIISEDFQEIDFGNWTNSSIKDLENDKLFRQFNLFRTGTRIPNGELIIEAQLRIINGIEKLNQKYQGKNIVIVSHADLIRLAIGYYAGIPIDLLQRIEISPASLSSVDLFEDNVRIFEINKHLE
jgi:probable phosphoglycerate mutase